MKLKTNLFQGKKPYLEEGQMIYQIENDDIVANRVERNTHCRRCVQFTKVIFYVLLTLLILFIGWFGFISIKEDRFSRQNSAPAMCGTPFLPDYEEWIKKRIQDINRNSTYEDDIIVAEWA